MTPVLPLLLFTVMGAFVASCAADLSGNLADDSPLSGSDASTPDPIDRPDASISGQTDAGSTDPGDGGIGIDPGRDDAGLGLAAKYAGYFPIGAAVGSWHLTVLDSIVQRDLNHLTAENAMKIQDIHPAEATWNTLEADRIANYARKHGFRMTGHALLWHRQAPAWMFQGVTAGDPASLELLKSRLKAHIEAMIARYGDVVDNWDVVNEAISDDPSKTYRDQSEGSTWHELFGSEEYIYWAYKYAHDALEAQAPGSAKGKLYYNEYVVTLKADKILSLLAWLKTKGITVDGVGFQSHENLSWPSVTDLQSAIDKFVSAGYKVKISELDLTVYEDYATGSFAPESEVLLTPELEARQAERFASLFALYRKNKQHITSVTFWGISDDKTWLDSEPVRGRNDHPLLYDDAHQPKLSRAAIMDF